MSKVILVGVSVGAHLGIAILLGEIRVEKARAATPIEIAEITSPPPAEPPKPPEIEPPAPPPDQPKQPRPSQAAPKPVPEVASTAPDESPSFDNLPDFGLALEGGVSGGGLAVPRPRAEKAARRPHVVKQLGPAPKPAADACSEAATKPKPLQVPQPAYTEAARSAGIEGRVRVRLSVDATGRVIEVEVLEGLGYGLDEAAIAAAQSATFSPALRCGRAVGATFTIAMRFSAA